MPRIRGVTARALRYEEHDAYQRALREWRKTERLYRRQVSQEIVFSESPIALVFIGDVHLGSKGTNYERAFHEASLVARTQRMYAVLCGDVLDNFIVPKLMAARYDTHISIPDEWDLVRDYLSLIAPKLLVSVEGNHERWTWVLSGVRYFQDVLAQIAPETIFDADDVVVKIRVGRANFPMRVRHRWQNNSIYNPTHGIEQRARSDGNFLIGVGAHTHAGGLMRAFNIHGKSGMAILCGTYKVYDEYARRLGVPSSNPCAAMTLILFEDGTKIPVEDLERAAKTLLAVSRVEENRKRG